MFQQRCYEWILSESSKRWYIQMLYVMKERKPVFSSHFASTNLRLIESFIFDSLSNYLFVILRIELQSRILSSIRKSDLINNNCQHSYNWRELKSALDLSKLGKLVEYYWGLMWNAFDHIQFSNSPYIIQNFWLLLLNLQEVWIQYLLISFFWVSLVLRF